MCGRMTLSKRELAEIADELAAVLDMDAAAYRPRYNIAPSDAHPIVRLVGGRRRVELARWGFPPTGPNRPPLFNARADTAPTKEAFRGAFRGGRCVVPADGFYEWRTTADQAGRQPVWIHRPDGKLLLMAGLWEAGRFTVLTTEPNDLLRPIHDRMPALLTESEAAAWLAAPTQRVLHPAPPGMLAVRPVSGRVNSVRNDDPGCLEPALGLPRQLSLV
jgi:putative SOS response-associated peptidase YedK